MRIYKSLNIEFSALILIMSLLIIYSHQSTLDSSIANYFYNSIDQWKYRDQYFLEKILHKGGVILTVVILVTLLSRIFYLYKFSKDKKQLDYFSIIFLTSDCSIIVIFLLKRWSTLPCPWNSVVFGGEVNPPSLWRAFAVDLPAGKCFPAGHSSGGFCFVSMYFGYSVIYGKRNFKTLIPGISLGVIFGVTQQIRGAHFLSHDITTLLIVIIVSWMSSLIYYYCKKKYEV